MLADQVRIPSPPCQKAVYKADRSPSQDDHTCLKPGWRSRYSPTGDHVCEQCNTDNSTHNNRCVLPESDHLAYPSNHPRCRRFAARVTPVHARLAGGRSKLTLPDGTFARWVSERVPRGNCSPQFPRTGLHLAHPVSALRPTGHSPAYPISMFVPGIRRDKDPEPPNQHLIAHLGGS